MESAMPEINPIVSAILDMIRKKVPKEDIIKIIQDTGVQPEDFAPFIAKPDEQLVKGKLPITTLQSYFDFDEEAAARVNGLLTDGPQVQTVAQRITNEHYRSLITKKTEPPKDSMPPLLKRK